MLVTTDMGNFQERTVKYLIKEKVLLYIDGYFRINGTYLEDSELRRPITVWSCFNHCLDYAKEQSNYKRINSLIGWLRKKDINIMARGKWIAIEKSQKSKTRGRSIDI
jgi:hypothetical protein